MSYLDVNNARQAFMGLRTDQAERSFGLKEYALSWISLTLLIDGQEYKATADLPVLETEPVFKDPAFEGAGMKPTTRLQSFVTGHRRGRDVYPLALILIQPGLRTSTWLLVSMQFLSRRRMSYTRLSAQGNAMQDSRNTFQPQSSSLATRRKRSMYMANSPQEGHLIKRYRSLAARTCKRPGRTRASSRSPRTREVLR